MYNNRELGKLGEDEAVKYVKSQGYNILCRNFECSQGEIDIIAQDKKEIVFIEVKTRTGYFYGQPAEAVTFFKLKHLKSTIKYYLYKNNLEDEFVRIDIIEVLVCNGKIIINHIKKAID